MREIRSALEKVSLQTSKRINNFARSRNFITQGKLSLESVESFDLFLRTVE